MIYPPCNFEVNPITHFGVISLFSSPDPKGHGCYQKRAILPYVLFLVTAAMFVGRMELNEEVL
jgi:uncharacterized membrane protein (GlpM family)